MRSRSDNPGSRSATTARSVPVKVDVEPLEREGMGPRVSLGELEDDPAQALRSVPHRQGRQDTLPKEVQFVPSARRRARSPTASSAKATSARKTCVACSRSSATTAVSERARSSAPDGPSAATALMTASPTSRSRCSTCRRSTAVRTRSCDLPADPHEQLLRSPTELTSAETLVDDDQRSISAPHQGIDCRAGCPPVVEPAHQPPRADPRRPAIGTRRARRSRRGSLNRRAASEAGCGPSRCPARARPA